MANYRVRWEIDIEADTPPEAAEKALEIHRDPASTATVFVVRLDGGSKQAETIDLGVREG